MDLNVKDMFENLKIDLSEQELIFLDESFFFKDPEVDEENNKIYIYLNVKQKVKDFNIIKTLEDKLENNKIGCIIEIYLQIDNFEYNEKDVEMTLNYIINEKIRIDKFWFELYKNFENIEYKNNELIFLTKNDIEFSKTTAQLNFLRKIFKKYGFNNLKIDVKRDEQSPKSRINNYLKTYQQIQPKKNSKDNIKYDELSSLVENKNNIIVKARISKIEKRLSKKGIIFYNITICDDKTAIDCIYFANFKKSDKVCYFDNENKTIEPSKLINVGDWVIIKGSYSFQEFNKQFQIIINEYIKVKNEDISNIDDAENKRIELHAHTKMSIMDGVSSVNEYLETAAKWNWKAIAITDHLNVQCFPQAYSKLEEINSQREEKLKIIYGAEINVINENFWYVKNPKNQSLSKSRFVIFDLETTGLSPIDDEIIEFGAVVVDGISGEIKHHDLLIKPKNKISSFTTQLTKITNEMVEFEPTIEIQFKKILNIIKDAILIAHNAAFDFNFLNEWSKRIGYGEIENTIIDTLPICRTLYPENKNHRLGTLCKKNYIFYDESVAHRANFDAEVLYELYTKIINRFKRENDSKDVNEKIKFETVNDLDNFKYLPGHSTNFKRPPGYHVNILVKNQDGIKDLYKIISYTHTKGFFNQPKIYWSELEKYRKKNNILIGAGCQNSAVFDAVKVGTSDDLINTIKKFDYVEIQPLTCYSNIIQKEEMTIEQLKTRLKKIINICKENNVLVVATSDAHYVDKNLKEVRQVYIQTKGLQGVLHPLYDFKGRIKDYPNQHLRTTKEMLEEFCWLEDEKLINEIVIENPNKINDLIDQDIQPIKKGNYPPTIKNVDQLLKNECYKNAYKIYGDPLPKIVENRLKKELDSIIKHKFSVVYWISHLLVKQSYKDGYLVGSRGSVGSSFVATMANITEVNPLKPHYICRKCQYSKFDNDPIYRCGYDLPKLNCPNCNEELIGEGHDIPFETFLGFDGDKVPDIDLNFSGNYQNKAHNFTKKIFGEANVFRAGTISTVAEKMAYGFVRNYYEQKNQTVSNAWISQMAQNATGVKRTTGQHPGGVIILPKEYEIEDFTPINYPADDIESSWYTTHFDFHAIHDNLLKMDILGHDDPTSLKMLYDLTKIDPQKIKTNDLKVYELFSSLKPLNIDPSSLYGETTSAIGLPEFGTDFVRSMLAEAKPKTFADLVQVSGLSHGTNVYIGNAQELINKKIANISEVIGCRDDIMVYLSNKGINASTAFKIMEAVRKGKGISNEWEQLMLKNNVPSWYIDSCKKIKYMFPKAHATAYVLMAYRIAWYKLYYPIEFYATWLSTKIKAIDINAFLNGEQYTRTKYQEIIEKQHNKTSTTKEDQLLTTYEVMIEMFLRNVKVKNIDLMKSDATKFNVIKENDQSYIIPPFTAIDGLGETIANNIIKLRDKNKKLTLNDLITKVGLNKTQFESLKKIGVLDTVKDNDQLKFNFFV